MDNQNLPKRIMNGHIDGRRRRERPIKRWQNDVEVTRMDVGPWKTKAHDRAIWWQIILDRPRPILDCSAGYVDVWFSLYILISFSATYSQQIMRWRDRGWEKQLTLYKLRLAISLSVCSYVRVDWCVDVPIFPNLTASRRLRHSSSLMSSSTWIDT